MEEKKFKTAIEIIEKTCPKIKKKIKVVSSIKTTRYMLSLNAEHMPLTCVSNMIKTFSRSGFLFRDYDDNGFVEVYNN